MYKLFEFAVEWIPTIRNKAELSSVQKFTCITAMADKRIKVYSVCLGVLCFPPKSVVQIKYLFSSAWLSCGIHDAREKS